DVRTVRGLSADLDDAGAVDDDRPRHDVHRVVHRQDGPVLDRHLIHLRGAPAFASASLPLRCATSSATMLTAISSGVTAPMSRPIGERTTSSAARSTPSASRMA